MSDARLQEEVIAELQSEPSIRHELIEVRTDDGVVTLYGYVATFAKKQAADSAVKRVRGVTGLVSEIAIRRYASMTVPQGVFAQEAAQAEGT
jgi:osmotically-inducible protein OsmY